MNFHLYCLYTPGLEPATLYHPLAHIPPVTTFKTGRPSTWPGAPEHQEWQNQNIWQLKTSCQHQQCLGINTAKLTSSVPRSGCWQVSTSSYRWPKELEEGLEKGRAVSLETVEDPTLGTPLVTSLISWNFVPVQPAHQHQHAVQGGTAIAIQHAPLRSNDFSSIWDAISFSGRAESNAAGRDKEPLREDDEAV